MIDDSPLLVIVESLLDRGHKATQGGQAVELFRREQYGGRFAVLGHHKRASPTSKFSYSLGKMRLERPDRDDVFGDLKR